MRMRKPAICWMIHATKSVSVIFKSRLRAAFFDRKKIESQGILFNVLSF